MVDLVGEEILALQTVTLAAIDITADDVVTDRVVVVIDRRSKRARPERGGFESGRTFEHAPTVVGAGLSDIDLLEGVLADVGDVEGAEGPVEAVAKRVAQAKRPDLGQDAGRADERIVDGNGI